MMQSFTPMGTPRVPGRADALLLHSWPGRLFLISAAVKLVISIVRLAGELPRVVQIVSTLASVGLLVSVGYFVYRLFLLTKRRMLWRVRTKLIFSYIFLGAIPALLIAAFF